MDQKTLDQTITKLFFGPNYSDIKVVLYVANNLSSPTLFFNHPFVGEFLIKFEMNWRVSEEWNMFFKNKFSPRKGHYIKPENIESITRAGKNIVVNFVHDQIHYSVVCN